MEESHGHGWNIPFHPDDKQLAWDAWQRATQHGDTYSLECRLRRADGVYHWWLIRGVPHREANGQVLKWFGTCTDIQDLKQAEEEVRRLNLTLEERVQERTAKVHETLAALQRSEERFRLATLATNDGIWDFDRDAGTIWWNSNYDQQFGPRPADTCSSWDWWLDRVHPEDRDRVKASLQAAIAGTAARWAEEYRFRRADASLAHVIDRAHLARDAQGKATRVIGAMTDLTDRKRAEEEVRESERFLRAVLDALSAHVAVLEESGRILAVNAAWEAFGAANGDGLSLGANYLAICDATCGTDAEIASQAAAGIRAVINRERPDFYLEYACPGPAEQRWFGMRVTPFPGEGPVRVVVAHENVTVRRQAEEQLRRMNEELEARVRERTSLLEIVNRELAEAKETADQANRAKSEFLSRMSHELRTPLNSILGFTQLLEMEDPAPGQRRYLQLLFKGGKHLLELINEVLDIARIEAGHMHLSPEPIRVNRIFQEVVELIHPLAEQRGIQLQIQPGLAAEANVLADNQRIRQVFLNLVSNAVKYNVERGSVFLSCEEVAPGRLRLSVSDTGPGIPPEKRERLFTPFDRLGAETTSIEGSGLGLTLSKRLTEAMGGSLRFSSTPGEGCVFWVELPSTPGAQERLPAGDIPEAAATTEGQQSRVLLYVEDNLDNLALLEAILAHRPHVRLLSALQGTIALDLAREHHPDLILLDVHLPDMKGDQVLGHLRENPRLRDIPVVVLSADATSQQIARLRAAGAADYLTKPLDVPRFLAVLDEYLKQAQV